MEHLPVSETMLNWLQTLVDIKSPAGDLEGVRQVIACVREWLGPSGEVHLEETPAGPMLEIWRGRGGALLLGHADTKNSIDLTRPWRREGQWVCGPGVLDMKAGIVLAAAVAKQLPPEVPFSLLITPDETLGSPYSQERIESFAQTADVVLVMEPAMPDGGLKMGRSGVGHYKLSIQQEPFDGERTHAMFELAHQLLWLEGLQNKLLKTTVNVEHVQGAWSFKDGSDRVEADIDIRIAAASEINRLEKILASPPRFDTSSDVRYEGRFNRPPMETTSDSQAWLDRASPLWESLVGSPLKGFRVSEPSDANLAHRWAPTLDGLGPIGYYENGEERVNWDSMQPRFQLIFELAKLAGL